MSFRKHGIIASSKKLCVGSRVKFGDAIIIGGPDGVKIVPNPQRIQALREIRRPRSRKEVQIYLGTVCSLIKWFPSLNVSTPNIGASILKGRIFQWNEHVEEEFLQVKKKGKILGHCGGTNLNLQRRT